jgi:hypothetical protein
MLVAAAAVAEVAGINGLVEVGKEKQEKEKH